MILVIFHRKPAAAIALARVVAREPLVSRVDRWGDLTIAVEVIVSDQQQLDNFVERFEPDEIHEVVSRVDRTRVVLNYLGRRLAV
jgi:hypothetical protein